MRLPEPYRFFVDRSLGSKVVPGGLRDAGLAIEVHDDHFAQNTSDEVWLADIGKKGWVLLTKDPRIRTNELERRALLENDVAAFMLGRGEVSGTRMVEVFVKALDGMQRALRRFDVGLIASVALDGGVTVLFAGSKPLPKAVRLKVRRGGYPRVLYEER